MHSTASTAGAAHPPVVGIRNHAVAVEHPADVLLRPVAAALLQAHQAARRGVQRLGVHSLVAGGQQAQQGPGGVDGVGAVALQLAVLLQKQTVAQDAV
jgi:hypothetical protein